MLDEAESKLHFFIYDKIILMILHYRKRLPWWGFEPELPRKVKIPTKSLLPEGVYLITILLPLTMTSATENI